jgi:hypothetical protein
MATIAQQTIVDTGLDPTYAAASNGGDTFVNDGSNQQFLHFYNANVGATRLVTITAEVATTDKAGFPTLNVPNIAVTIPISGEKMIGPIPKQAYGTNPAITYDDESDLTVALLKVG